MSVQESFSLVEMANSLPDLILPKISNGSPLIILEESGQTESTRLHLFFHKDKNTSARSSCDQGEVLFVFTKLSTKASCQLLDWMFPHVTLRAILEEAVPGSD